MLAILFSLKSMETLENGLQTHSGASLASCHSVDADAWCKWALRSFFVFVPVQWSIKPNAARNQLRTVRKRGYVTTTTECERGFLHSLKFQNIEHSNLNSKFKTEVKHAQKCRSGIGVQVEFEVIFRWKNPEAVKGFVEWYKQSMVHVSWLFWILGNICSYTISTGALGGNHLIAPLGHLVRLISYSTGHLSSSHGLPIFCFHYQRNETVSLGGIQRLVSTHQLPHKSGGVLQTKLLLTKIIRPKPWPFFHFRRGGGYGVLQINSNPKCQVLTKFFSRGGGYSKPSRIPSTYGVVRSQSRDSQNLDPLLICVIVT